MAIGKRLLVPGVTPTYTLLMRRKNRPRLFTLFTLWCLCLASSRLLAYEVSSSAIVNEDGSLRIKGRTIQLFGIHIPRTSHTCDNYRRPPLCSSRAALALEFKIDGFVRCEIVGEAEDGSIIGKCHVNSSSFSEGDDLSAYLLERGWALALPDAPFEYQALEKIAQSRQVGLWGIPMDRFKRP